jgi:CRP/FNR family transcriptional regulator, anaerobic regulatory protein
MMPYSKLLKNISLNCTLTIEQEQELISKCKLLKHKKKSTIISVDEIDEHIYFINKGIVKSCISNEKNEKFIVSFHKAESWITDMQTYATRQPAIASYICVTEVESIKIPLDLLEDLMKENLKLAHHFRVLIQNRIIYNQMDRFRLISLNAEERYKNFLETNPSLSEKIPLKDIASFLGIFPESLSRIRRKLLGIS